MSKSVESILDFLKIFDVFFLTWPLSAGPFCGPLIFFSGMIRDSAQKSELQAKSRSYSPEKSELQPGRPPESEPTRPEKEPEWGLGASTEAPLEPS